VTTPEKLGVTDNDSVEEIAQKAWDWATQNLAHLPEDERIDECLKDFTACIAYRRIAIYETSNVFVVVVGDGAEAALKRQQERWEA